MGNVVFYKNGFFGYGEVGNFKYYSLAHLIPIVILIFSIGFMYKYRNNIKNYKYEENIRYTIAFIAILNEILNICRLLYIGCEDTSCVLLSKAPFHICPIMSIITAFMLMKKSKKLYKVSYFICLSLLIIPLITPSIITKTGPCYFKYYQFWLQHFLPIISVLYLTFVHNYRVKYKDIIKSSIFLFIISLIALYLDIIIPDANFFFLKRSTTSSFGNLIPVDNIYIRFIIYIPIAFILLSLTYIPIYIHNKRISK